MSLGGRGHVLEFVLAPNLHWPEGGGSARVCAAGVHLAGAYTWIRFPSGEAGGANVMRMFHVLLFRCSFITHFCMNPSIPIPLRFDHATGVMYTCDAFGMHYCTDQPYDVDIKAIMPHYR